MSVEAIVFDYGGVLTTPVRASVGAWLAADGIDPRSYRRALEAWFSADAPTGTPVHRLETGEITEDEFGALLAAELVRHDGDPVVAEGILGRLFAGMRSDPDMLALAAELRAAGLRTALLSNSWGRTYPADVLADFAPVVISGDVGLRKPQAAIYELMLDRLGLPADECVFIDDNEANVDGARAVGMRGLLHTEYAATRAALANLIPVLGGAA